MTLTISSQAHHIHRNENIFTVHFNGHKHKTNLTFQIQKTIVVGNSNVKLGR